MYGYADKALYFVKNNGKDDYYLYSHMSFDDRNAHLLEDQMKLPQILSQVTERKFRKGAYLVEYDRFTYIYQFIVRNIERSCQEVQIILLSLETEEGSEPPEKIEDCMMLMETAVTHSLRRGDVTTRLSAAQQIVILMDTNAENGRMVADRIVAKYNPWRGTGDYQFRTTYPKFRWGIRKKAGGRINFWREKTDTYNRGDNGLSPDATVKISSRRRLKQMKYMKESSNQYNPSTA